MKIRVDQVTPPWRISTLMRHDGRSALLYDSVLVRHGGVI
jgi:hypothetical protein